MGNQTHRGTCGGARPPVELNEDALKAAMEYAPEGFEEDEIEPIINAYLAALPKQETTNEN